MFTGIIESIGKVQEVVIEGTNVHYTISTNLTSELKIDQSVAHNGVCLTVIGIEGANYVVTAVKETMDKTNLSHLKVGSHVNIERAMRADARFDGHIVQGHVDRVAKCEKVLQENGSWVFTFAIDDASKSIVEKGSVTINGISLTSFNVTESSFQVTIIPYTFEHTTMSEIQEGTAVNIEFDIIGKYIKKLVTPYL